MAVIEEQTLTPSESSSTTKHMFVCIHPAAHEQVLFCPLRDALRPKYSQLTWSFVCLKKKKNLVVPFNTLFFFS